MKPRRRFLEVALATSLVAGGAVTAPAAAAPLDAAPPSTAADGPHGCESDQVCLYENTNQTIMVARMESCVFHDVRDKWFRSYVNNLRPFGGRAEFYDNNLRRIMYTKPSPDKDTVSPEVAFATAYVRPC